jgi:t-SNARE complex subunit (syntaxin)
MSAQYQINARAGNIRELSRQMNELMELSQQMDELVDVQRESVQQSTTYVQLASERVQSAVFEAQTAVSYKTHTRYLAVGVGSLMGLIIGAPITVLAGLGARTLLLFVTFGALGGARG